MMRMTTTTTVTIPSWTFSQFKAAILRIAKSEHRFSELGNISVFESKRNGALSEVRVLIDTFSDYDVTEDAADAAVQTVSHALVKVHASQDIRPTVEVHA